MATQQQPSVTMEDEFYQMEESPDGWRILFGHLCKTANSQAGSQNEGRRPDKRPRNRYGSVSPIDSTRVKLNDDTNDYINANYVKVDDVKRLYIITQGPLKHTCGHFWQMVWEQKTKGIAMLCNCVELRESKCHPYWPQSINEPEVKFGPFRIELISLEDKDVFRLSHLRLENSKTKETRVIVHYHYTKWPHSGVPKTPDDFLLFLDAVRKGGVLNEDVGPCVVHCSTGRGRSGIFCLVDVCLKKIEDTGDINIQSILLDMTRQRLGLVGAANQLRFSYVAILQRALNKISQKKKKVGRSGSDLEKGNNENDGNDTETALSLSPEAKEGYKRFYFKNNGVLYENSTIRIDVKSDFTGNIGYCHIFFWNKSTFSLMNFTGDITVPPELKMDSNPLPQKLDAGAHIQWSMEVECVNVFMEAPVMKISFVIEEVPQAFLIKLPIMLNKFSEGTVMDSSAFFTRWKQLSGPVECQKIFTAANPIEKKIDKAKLTGFGLSILDDVDPNPDNLVGAFIIYTTKKLVDCLLCLEPNHQTQMYHLTIRASDELVSKLFCDIISGLITSSVRLDLLQSKKHELVMYLLSPADDQWEEIGSLLEISPQMIGNLKSSSSSNSDKLNAVIKSWEPTPVIWEKLLNKSTINRDGLALKVLKLFESDDVKDDNNIPVLSVVLNDVLKEMPWNDLGTALGLGEDLLKEIKEGDSYDRQLAVISLWVRKCGATEESLVKALENLKSSTCVSSFKIIDREYLEKAFQSGRVKARVSKAVIQGPARAGKTSLRCLITGKRYESNKSTGCIETPRVAIHKYGSFDGTFWKFVSDDEMLTEAVHISKHYEDETKRKNEQDLAVEAHDPLTSDNTCTSSSNSENNSSTNTSASDTASIATSAPITSKQTSSSFMKKDSFHHGPEAQSKNILPEDLARNIMKTANEEMQKIFDSVADDPDRIIHREWLYFIDSGGQIQFQQLLHAFLPCASVLLLVTNLAEGFSDQSSTEMQLDDGIQSVSEYSPTNEVLMEQLIIMVDACSEQQREIIIRDPYLREIIKPPQKLHVMAIATHLDEFEELLQKGKMSETIENKQEKFCQIFRSLKDTLICPNYHNSEIFYTIDGRKAKYEKGSQDEIVQKICEELRQQAFKIDIPLRWYAFEILLRKTAESFHGVLTLDVCKAIGINEMKIESKEVESALKFFHLLNTMLYYPESKAPDLVFAHPRHLFDLITELAILIIKIRNKESVSESTASIIEFAHMGIISKEFIAISKTSKKILDTGNIPNFGSKLLLLFEHLMIAKTVPAADYGEGKFFMPALLPLTKHSVENQSADSPFVFRFKKSAPIGFFCTFIIYLLSSHKKEEKPDWLIPPLHAGVKLSSNYIVLRSRKLNMCDVRFLEHRDRYEVYCDKAEHRIALRKELTKVMKQLIKEKEISFEKRPEPALYCPCGESNVPHTATIEAQGAPLLCAVFLKGLTHADDNSSHSCWSWLSSTTNKGVDIHVFSSTLLEHHLNEEPEHTELVNKLSSIDFQWEELGIALGVDRKDLASLSADMSNIVKLDSVMHFWRKKLSPPYTWVTILDIISGAVVNNQKLRCEIEQFLGTKEVNEAPTQSNDVNPLTGAAERAAFTDDAKEMEVVGTTHTVLQKQQEKKEQERQQTEELKQATNGQEITMEQKQLPSHSTSQAVANDMEASLKSTAGLESMIFLEQNMALLNDCTIDQIGDLLDKIGLGLYKETFKEMGVDGDAFFYLTDDYLEDPKEFNMTKKFHRDKVMRIVNGLTAVAKYISKS